MSAPATKDKDDKDITSTKEYKASLAAYQAWCKKDRKARYTILYCMHDHLIGEFENYPIAKEMWDNIHYRYGQTSKMRLCALHLKWMTYMIDSSRSITEHVRSLQAMLRDLKGASVDISEREQRTNVLRTLPAGDNRWKPFITMMTHNENIKILLKSPSTSSWKMSS